MESLQKMMNLVSTILDIDQNLNGQHYLEEFVKNIAKNLNVKYVLIGHPTDNTFHEIKTDAICAENKIIENFTYTLKDSPCEIVLSGERVCIHDSNVSIDFPDDLLLQEMKIEAYVGAPVVSKNKNTVSSILVLLDEKPMKNKEFFTIVTEFLAQRAASEIEKIQNEEKLKKEIEKRNQVINLAKEYELKLNEKQILLESILTTIPDMVWIKDINGKFLLCNPEFEKLFGKKENEIVGKTDYDFFDKGIADTFRKADLKAINSKETLIIEEWVTYASNKQKVLLDTSKKAMYDNNGNVIGILGIGHNITQRQQKEEELKESNSLAHSLAQSQEVLLSLFDKGEAALFRWKNTKQWQVEYVSEGVNRILGYGRNDFLNNDITYSNCIHKSDLSKVEDEVTQAIEKSLDYFKHEPYRVITKCGDEKWVLDHTVVQKDANNNITHFIGYITDITEQIKSQEIMFHQAKIASLGEMLGNIAHQWRQPLSVISTTATGAKLKKEYGLLQDEEFYKNMDSINDTVQYLSQTIDDFRNFFLADSSTESEITLENTLEKVLSLIKDSYKSTNIEIIKNYKKSPIKVRCNENLFIQALINIFNNARDALSTIKGLDKKLVFINLESLNNKISIKIKDNAKGIPTDIIHKVFDPYFTTKHKEQGTGIGLYMTNQIITKHLKSEITVKNIDYSYLDKNYSGALFKIQINKK